MMEIIEKIVELGLFAVMAVLSLFAASILLGFLIILIGKRRLNSALDSMSKVAFECITRYSTGSASYVIIVMVHTAFLACDMSYLTVWRWIFLALNWTVFMLSGIALKKTGKLNEL